MEKQIVLCTRFLVKQLHHYTVPVTLLRILLTTNLMLFFNASILKETGKSHFVVF